MKGDLFECPKCGNTATEGDVPVIEFYCSRTSACRARGGDTVMKPRSHNLTD